MFRNVGSCNRIVWSFNVVRFVHGGDGKSTRWAIRVSVITLEFEYHEADLAR